MQNMVMNKTGKKIYDAALSLFIIAVFLSNGCSPVKTEKRKWVPEALLPRAKEAYTNEAFARANADLRRNLLIEKARFNYYGALFNKQYAQAYEFLSNELKKKISPLEFENWFKKFINPSRSSSSVVNMGAIDRIQITREYAGNILDKPCKVSIILLGLNSTVKGQPGPIQTLAMIDLWETDGKRAFVIPGDFAKLNASYSPLRKQKR